MATNKTILNVVFQKGGEVDIDDYSGFEFTASWLLVRKGSSVIFVSPINAVLYAWEKPLPDDKGNGKKEAQ